MKTSCADENSFKELFYTYYCKLCRYAYYISGQKDQAEEIVQNVFIKIWQSGKKLKIYGDMGTYLFISVKNSAYNYYKRNLNRRNREAAYSNEDNSNNNMIFDKELFLLKLNESLKLLPDRCREIFCLKNFEGLTYNEIAQYLNISEKTVDVQIFRALRRLRELMGKYKKTFYSNKE